MKLFALRTVILAVASFSLATRLVAAPAPPTQPAPVSYNPVAKLVQGNQPLTQSYELAITSPANLANGNSVTVSLGLSVLTKPATGVTDATALNFISCNPAVLTFTGPNQPLTTTVTVTVPVGNFAGDYAYKITPSGWPTNVGSITDTGATVNARVSPPNSTDTSPPAILLLSPADSSVYTYAPTSGIPVTVPINFSATVGTNGEPIDGMLAFIDNTPVSVNVLGLLTLSASATGSAQLTTPGSHTVSVLATNRYGTSRASAGLSILVSAPPPTITAASPLANATFNYTLGSAGASVPVSFTANSAYGNITALSASLDGSPVVLNVSGVGSATTAAGTATLTISTPGSYSLVLSASNDYGAAAPVTIPFTVRGVTPAPTVSIISPASGSAFTRTAGDPATVVNYSFQGGATYGTVTAVTVTVDGVPVTASVTGLNTPGITGSGTLSYTAGGAHTLNVTVSNGGATASASSSFAVNQTQPQVCRDLTWLPPISLNKTIEGGATMPIKFTLSCHGDFVRDTSVLIAIYEVFPNGTHSNPVIYPYGTGRPASPDYSIDGKKYQLNFKTARGVHGYRIEVYSSASGPLQLLGSKELNTKSNDDDHDDGHDEDHGHD